MNKQITLAYDMAVTSGSFAIYLGNSQLAQSAIDENRACSDRMLSGIRHLLVQHGLDARAIRTVLFTTGPGGYTGIRAGISTALGLGRAVEAELFGYRVFDILLSDCAAGESAAAIIDGGRSGFLVSFKNDEVRHVMVNDRQLRETLDASKVEKIVFVSGRDLVQKVADDLNVPSIDASDNVTKYLYHYHLSSRGKGSSIDPCYGRDLI